MTARAAAATLVLMEFVANLQVGDGTVYVLANWRPGTLRCDGDGISFLERGATEPDQLGASEMASVAIATHLIGADDVVVTTKSGAVWSIKLNGGEQLVDALRANGVPIAKR